METDVHGVFRLCVDRLLLPLPLLASHQLLQPGAGQAQKGGYAAVLTLENKQKLTGGGYRPSLH
jgi:hypothetical protein